MRTISTQVGLPRRRTIQVLRSRLGIGPGIAISVSCGGGGQGCGGSGGGVTCPPSTGLTCDSCAPGTNLYSCAISSSNNTICAPDDFTADQHCAALGSVVQYKEVCDHHATGGGQGGANDGADETGAAGRSPRPESKDATKER